SATAKYTRAITTERTTAATTPVVTATTSPAKVASTNAARRNNPNADTIPRYSRERARYRASDAAMADHGPRSSRMEKSGASARNQFKIPQSVPNSKASNIHASNSSGAAAGSTYDEVCPETANT